MDPKRDCISCRKPMRYLDRGPLPEGDGYVSIHTTFDRFRCDGCCCRAWAPVTVEHAAPEFGTGTTCQGK